MASEPPASSATTPSLSSSSPGLSSDGTFASFDGDLKRAIVIGAGPVGCLAALSLSKMGWAVDLYEGRPDMRLPSSKASLSQRSINLAVSSRGIAALHAVNPQMATTFLASAIPMKGRMLHHDNGRLESQLYDPHGQCINSLDRGILNEQLLEEAARAQNIRIFFNHKLTTIDFASKKAVFARSTQGSDSVTVGTTFDLCVGADGSYSNVRRQMMRFVKMDYEQVYIPHEYVELRMPPGPVVAGEPTFLMDPNHLHIWPRHSFMLIALPNKDKSFTCTLFAPTRDLSQLQTPSQILGWFNLHFSDAVPLIGEDLLVDDFKRNPQSSLISIKAKPYHYKDAAILLGDAAHSMVPFYGQGLNCGLEDVRVLQSIMVAHKVDGTRKLKLDSEDDTDGRLLAALEEYSQTRHADLKAICELAMQNYTEMRHDVTTPIYRLLKAVDTFIALHAPLVQFETILSSIATIPFLPKPAIRGWIPLYTMVTFRPDISYATAQSRAEQQARILRASAWSVGVFSAVLVGAVTWHKRWKS